MTKAQFQDVTSGPIQFRGGSFLVDILNEYPEAVRKQLINTGFRRAAARYRTLMRRDAPKKSGELRKSIGVQKGRRVIWVGLTTRFYYKTLDLDTNRGPAMRRWFEASAERHADAVLAKMNEETLKAVYKYADRQYLRSRTRAGV